MSEAEILCHPIPHYVGKMLPTTTKEDGAEITANSLHPGVITSNLYRHQSFVEVFNNLPVLVAKNGDFKA
ncbi:hypothetical protein CsSME_00029203 [Camellia sinensis var. sinensis]